MYGVVVCAVLLAALVSPSQEHDIGDRTCELEFLKSLNETARLKQKCGCVTFSDCCQVFSNTSIYNGTISYTHIVGNGLGNCTAFNNNCT